MILKDSFQGFLRFSWYAALVLPLLAVGAAAQNAVGYVQEINGSWTLASQTVRSGQKVPAGGILKRQSAGADDTISIANLRGKIIISCAGQSCASTIKLPGNQSQRGYLSEAYTAAMGLIYGSPGRYSIHRSRGEDLPNAVVKLDKEQLDLSPIFKSAGKYHLRWREIMLSEKPEVGDWLETTKVEVKDGKASSAIEKLKPGLYEVNLMRERMGNLESTRSFAWVLIASTKNYKKNAAAFDEAVKTTGEWKELMSDTTVNTFLQASLDNLARQNAKNNK